MAEAVFEDMLAEMFPKLIKDSNHRFDECNKSKELWIKEIHTWVSNSETVEVQR